MNPPEEMFMSLPKDLINEDIPLNTRIKAAYYYCDRVKAKINTDLDKLWNSFSFVKTKQKEIKDKTNDLLAVRSKIDKHLEILTNEWEFYK